MDDRDTDIILCAQARDWADKSVGPRSRSLADRDRAVFLGGGAPVLSAVSKADGIWLQDADGRCYMDFHGDAAHHLGHGHPKLKAAIARQMDELPSAPRNFTSDPAVRLGEALVRVAPPGLTRSLFTPGVAEAMDTALRMARAATGRTKVVGFWGSWADGEHVAPFACGRCAYGFACPGGEPDLAACRMACARMVRYTLENEGDVAAFIAPPIRPVPTLPPPGFWQEVRQACDELGVVLIFDETAIGLGRTGRLFGAQHVGVEPDILVLGSALGGGLLPMAALLARPGLELDRPLHDRDPVRARAGLATLEVIEQERLTENAARLGGYALARLHKMAEHLPLVAEVRGVGLLLGIDVGTPDPDPETARRVQFAAMNRGLSLSLNEGSVLTLAPPLTATQAEMDLALDIIENCLVELT